MWCISDAVVLAPIPVTWDEEDIVYKLPVNQQEHVTVHERYRTDKAFIAIPFNEF